MKLRENDRQQAVFRRRSLCEARYLIIIFLIAFEAVISPIPPFTIFFRPAQQYGLKFLS